MRRCSWCGGRLDRPGLFACGEIQHAAPDLAQRIVAVVEDEMNDRRGLHWNGLPDETVEELRDTLAEKIRALLP